MSTTTATILLALCSLAVVILLVFSAKLYSMVKELSASFSKLGFLVREDAKKYFDEASAKVVDTNLQMRESYVDIVEEATKGALSQTAHTIEGSIVSAQQEANQIILRARDDARRINIEARKMAVDEMSRSLVYAADTIAWVMERYVRETFSVGQHKRLIDKLVDEYLNEYRN